jgi:hypothetical protein
MERFGACIMAEIELLTKKLPSTGLGYKFKKIAIKPMVYQEILNYQSDIEKSKNAVSEYLLQLKYLISSIPNGNNCLLYDAPAIMAVRSFSSTCKDINSTLTFSYMCPVHQKKEVMEVTLDKFHFNEIDKTFKKIKQVKLNEQVYDIRHPTVGDFINIAEEYKTKVPLKQGLKYLFILSMINDLYDDSLEEDSNTGIHSLKKNQIIKDILNAKHDDIVVLEWLYRQITNGFDGFKATCKNDCQKEGENAVIVKIDSLIPITEVFQNILLSGLSSEIPIILGGDST